MNKKQELNLNIIKVLSIIIFIILIVQLVNLQIINGDNYLKEAEKNIIRRTFTKASRGLIYDCKGHLMAENRPSFLLTITPSEIKNKEKTFSLLGRIISMSNKEIEAKIEYSPYPVFTPVEIKHNLDFQTVAELSEVITGLQGISIETEPVRSYPNGNLSSHTLGYVGLVTQKELEKGKEKNYQPWEMVGKDGIEFYYNDFLRGKQGIKEIEINAEGNFVKVIGETLPISGNNIYLTIDLDAQKICDEAIGSMLDRLSGDSMKKAGCAVIISVKTGDILALCSKPDFNPNLFSTGISEKDYNSLINHPLHPLFNRIISGLYPPASTFKIITSTAALEEHITSSWSNFFCPGFITVEDRVFNCDNKGGHGPIDFLHAISESCDVVFYELGMKLGPEKIKNYGDKYNLGKKSGIDLPGEEGGLLPSNEWKEKEVGERWYTGDTVNMSIGQGYVLTTPLQMAVVTAMLANGGTFHQPHLVNKIISENKEPIYEYKEKNTYNANFQEVNLQAIKEGMRLAVKEGTAKAANTAEVNISGKTGTAENIVTPENPGGENHAWFVAFAPSEDPEIAVVVFMEQAGGYAKKSAVPVGAEIIKKYFEMKKNEQIP